MMVVLEIYLTIPTNVVNTIGLDYGIRSAAARARKIKCSRLKHIVQEIELPSVTGEYGFYTTINRHWLDDFLDAST